MIYIKNNTEIQTIYINRNDEMPCGGHHAGSSDYMDGYEEGFGDGYESGTTDQINRLASTAFTYNSAFTRADGWSSVTVNVPQSGHTSEELQEWYDSGYTSGVTDGYESGFTDGYDSGFTDGYNSGYTDGYNSGYTSGTTDGFQSGYTSGFTDGYSSGYTDGEQSIIDTFTSTTINQNGVYGDSAHPFTSVTVNVPTSGGTSILGSGSFSANGTYSATSENLDGYNVVTIDVPQDYTQEDIDNAYESGYTDCLDSLETVSFSANGIYNAESSEGWNKVIVNVPTSGSSAILGELNVSQDGVYVAENDGLDGYSVVTVNTHNSMYPYGELYALYCVDASLGEWSYSDSLENRTADCYNIPFMVYPLSDVHIKISGNNNNINVNRNLYIQYDPSGCPITINYDGVEKTGRLKAVSTLDEFNSINFANRNDYIRATFDYINENDALIIETFQNAMKMNDRAIGISGSCFYLLNYFDCCYHVGIDSNGRAYYADQENRYYPTAGRCYPVFRKLVNEVYKYTVVDAVNAPTTPQNNYI